MSVDLDFSVVGIGDEERESWKADHDEAMKCYDTERMLRYGIDLFYSIRLADKAWSKQVQRGSEKFDPERVRSLYNAYRWWLKPCGRILSVLQESERKSKVEGAEAFRDCVRTAERLVATDLEALLESSAQAAEGNSEPLTEEVWRELGYNPKGQDMSCEHSPPTGA
jgi:hypothetical protein